MAKTLYGKILEHTIVEKKLESNAADVESVCADWNVSHRGVIQSVSCLVHFSPMIAASIGIQGQVYITTVQIGELNEIC